MDAIRSARSILSKIKSSERVQAIINPVQKIGAKVNGSENFWGFLFISPVLIGFLVFTLGAVLFSLTMSFTDWNMLRGFGAINFIGIENYRRVFNSRDFWISLRNNGQLLLTIPICVILSMILAAIVNRGVYFRSAIRTLFFLPFITNVVAVSTIWRALMHPSRGPINMTLYQLGVPMESLPGWLSSTSWFIPALGLILIWQNLGFYTLMFSAGLQNIPSDYYEAASIDGAGAVKRFLHITMPLITPVTFLVVMLGIIANLQLWTLVQVMTPGGVGFGSASYTLSFFIYLSSFVHFRSGFGAALAWVLFFLTFCLTLIQWVFQKKWVNY